MYIFLWHLTPSCGRFSIKYSRLRLLFPLGGQIGFFNWQIMTHFSHPEKKYRWRHIYKFNCCNLNIRLKSSFFFYFAWVLAHCSPGGIFKFNMLWLIASTDLPGEHLNSTRFDSLILPTQCASRILKKNRNEIKSKKSNLTHFRKIKIQKRFLNGQTKRESTGSC